MPHKLEKGTYLNVLGFTEVSDRGDMTAWKKLLRRQTGVDWNWNKGTINMDPEWWNKIKNVSVWLQCHVNLFILQCHVYLFLP